MSFKYIFLTVKTLEKLATKRLAWRFCLLCVTVIFVSIAISKGR